MREDGGGGHAIGSHGSKSKSEGKGQSKRKSQSKGRGRPRSKGCSQRRGLEPTSTRRKTSRDSKEAIGGSSLWTPGCQRSMGERRISASSGYRSGAADPPEAHRHGGCVLLPSRLQSCRDHSRSSPRRSRNLSQSQAHGDYQHQPASVRDRTPRSSLQSSSLLPRLQSRDRSRRSHSSELREGSQRQGSRRRLGLEFGKSPTGSPRGRACRTEKESCRGHRGPTSSPRREEVARERKGQIQERQEKEEEKEGQRGKERCKGQEGKEKEEGGSQRRSRHELEQFQRGSENGWVPGEGCSRKGTSESLPGHRPRLQRTSQEPCSSKSEEVSKEEGRQLVHVFIGQGGILECQRSRWDYGRIYLRAGIESEDPRRQIPWGIEQPGNQLHALKPHHGSGVTRPAQPVVSLRDGICETTHVTKGPGASPARSHDPGGLSRFAAETTASGSSRLGGPEAEKHRAYPERFTLGRKSEARDPCWRSTRSHTSAGGKQRPEGALCRSADEMGGIPRRERRSRTRSRRKRKECAEGQWRQRIREGQARWKAQRGQDRRLEKERLRSEGAREEGPGALAPEERLKIGNCQELAVDRDKVLCGNPTMGRPYEGGSAMASRAEDSTGLLESLGGGGIPPTMTHKALQEAEAMTSTMNSFEDSSMGGRSTDLHNTHQGFETIQPGTLSAEKKVDALSSLEGKTLGECGNYLLQRFLEVCSLRSKTTGRYSKVSLLPLPTSRDHLRQVFPDMNPDEFSWMICLVICLNSLWGEDLFNDGAPNRVQLRCLRHLSECVIRFCKLHAPLPLCNWKDYMSVKTVDYRGDEVRVARWFSWGNVAAALPREIGRVPLADVCSMGCREYVLHFDEYLKPRDQWVLGRPPRVMVEDHLWGEVCRGLVDAGVCVYLDESEVFTVNDKLLLNGMFGVSKEEWTDSGTEIYRLIMNLIPLNQLCLPLAGDVNTLPAWSGMSPFFIQPTDSLVVSSEDVKCFFYTLSVPSCWYKYLAFNKPVPSEVLPVELRSKSIYLASKVLPMGFLNSVSLAQNVHRRLASLSASRCSGVNAPEGELRKDRPFPQAEPKWRIYLDNFDLLERVEATRMVEIEGTLAPGALALRNEYEHWGIPRNVKKSVQRSSRCEVQGATVDGIAGIAFPRESKLSKYFSLALSLMECTVARQKQWQIVCGGLVYFSMFRRPLLGGLNRVWTHIEEFNSHASYVRPIPPDCRIEVLRSLGLLPLAFMDFRLPVHSQVTCSDASTTGGGICGSVGTTVTGQVVSQGSLRGDTPDLHGDHSVLVIGLFDGIGALRVAIDLMGIPVAGYVSIEKHAPGQRVVEANFPGVVCHEDVTQIGEAEVRHWSLTFSQASIVLLGGGPPCQGVSGLNADRRGALKDLRSCLFSEVPRIRDLVKTFFTWCSVYTLMESVASMDDEDRDVMTSGIGCNPVLCDAGDFTWCHRPRLYWCDWELIESTGVEIRDRPGLPDQMVLSGIQDISQVIRSGWVKVDPSKSFPTFTTSRPRQHPGRKPAGVTQCSSRELERWVEDQHRFPPYQYLECHSLVNRRNELRLPDVNEREMMMGFPWQYTSMCLPKSDRKGKHYDDTRLTLLGNSWSVPVIGVLINQLFSRLGLCPVMSPQSILDEVHPGNSATVQGRLTRLPLNPSRTGVDDASQALADKLCNLLSIKGEDILLTTPVSQQVKYHRLRSTVPGKLWKWKVISGWKWHSSSEHINSLELRAVFTSLRWRIEHQGHLRCKFIHLTDSLVCLHCLSRGRSSSRKLRRTMARINALLLCSSVHPFWGYIHTDQNPADKPSRWGRRVRTRFRNAKA